MGSHLAWMTNDGEVLDLSKIGGDLEILGKITAVDSIQFLLTPPGTSPAEGQLIWNEEDGVLEFGVPGGKVVFQLGLEVGTRVTNDEGDEIPNGTPVFVSGGVGNNPLVKIADKRGFASAGVLGLTTESIANKGYVTSFGLVRDVDSIAFTPGSTFWIGDDGELLADRPEAGIDTALIVGGGICLRQHATEGVLFVNVYIVPRLVGLSDTHVVAPLSDGQFITWHFDNHRFEVVPGVAWSPVDGTIYLLRTVYQPSDVINVTAAGGIAVTNTIMRVQGDGGPIDITANPQIAAGIDGEYLIVEGSSDLNTVTLNNGDGLHLHGPIILQNKDHVVFVYNENNLEWDEVSRSSPASEKAISYSSPFGSTGTFHDLGFYEYASTPNNFSPVINFGSANVARGAHLSLVTGAVPGDDVTITVTGNSINDLGVGVIGDTATIFIPSGTPIDSYFETPEKWNGEITIETTGGTPILCNYLFSKYWDNANSRYTVRGIDLTWRGGANTSLANIRLQHHKAEGWTYQAGDQALPPDPIGDMVSDNAPDNAIGNNAQGAWKRTNFLVVVAGDQAEGILLAFDSPANNTFETVDGHVRITPG